VHSLDSYRHSIVLETDFENYLNTNIVEKNLPLDNLMAYY
jgi:hypothetical protein